MNPDSPDQVRTLMEVAEALAREAGALVRDGRRRLVTVAATKSSDQDVVTAMDLASEALLRRRLAELRPDDAILGEEEALPPGHVRASPGWWTRSTARSTTSTGSPAYAVSVAAVTGPDPAAAPDPATWTALAGCVVRPGGRPDVHWRVAGSARRSTGRRCGSSAARPLIDSLVGTGFGYVAVEAAGAGPNRGRTVAAGT